MSRPRKPTVVKKLEGDIHKERHNKQEPVIKGEAKCPDYLNKEAKKVWEEIAPELIRSGIATAIDVHELAEYCDIIAQIKKHDKKIAKDGEYYISKNGVTLTNIMVYNRNKLYELAHKRRIELGMTPAARSKVNADSTKQPKDKLDEFLTTYSN